MRKNYVARLGTLALVMAFISSCVIGSTLARYVSEVSGEGTVAVAAWNVKLMKGTEEVTEDFDFKLASTKDTNTNVASDFVAPGDKGKLEYQIKDDGSNVAYKYSVTIDDTNLTNNKINLKFYKDENCTQAWSDVEATANLTDQSTGKVESGVIYWKWADDAAKNADDTAAGKNAGDLTFTVKLKATQIITGDPAA